MISWLCGLFEPTLSSGSVETAVKVFCGAHFSAQTCSKPEIAKPARKPKDCIVHGITWQLELHTCKFVKKSVSFGPILRYVVATSSCARFSAVRSWRVSALLSLHAPLMFASAAAGHRRWCRRRCLGAICVRVHVPRATTALPLPHPRSARDAVHGGKNRPCGGSRTSTEIWSPNDTAVLMVAQMSTTPRTT